MRTTDSHPPQAGAPRSTENPPAAVFLAEAMAKIRGEDRLTLITVPAPAARPEALLRALPQRPAVVWSPPAGPSLAGAGSAWRMDVAGPQPTRELLERADLLWSTLRAISHPACGVVSARLLGGMAFDPARQAGSLWRSFPDCSFVLPQWCYERNGRRASLGVVMRGEETDARRQEIRDEFAGIMATLADRRSSPRWRPRPAQRVDLEAAQWRELVQAIRAAIHQGHLAKVVLARVCSLEFAVETDVVSLLTRLASEEAECTRFAFGFEPGAATFLGATPERLIVKRGRSLVSEAMAGSIAVPEGPAKDAGQDARAAELQLLGSQKDLAEHALVVRSIQEALGPRCRTLSFPPQPRIHRFGHVMHLQTPFAGELRRPAHILELVAALHPTPSVGGVPTAEALRWIAAREPEPRGWYAGPVGWFDARGDGEFAVAIRSGLVAGRQAWVYAGAGIVADSDPDDEYAETGLKQRALLHALGVVEDERSVEA